MAPAVLDFNERLRAGGSGFQLIRDDHGLDAAVTTPGNFIEQRQYVLLDDGVVRGGYRLIAQCADVAGRQEEVEFLQLPLSEGIVDPQYALTGVQILRDAMRRAPLMFALGIGSVDNPVSQILKAYRARLHPVPFFFRVCRPNAFLRSIQPLRRTPLRRGLLDLIAASGIAVPAVLGLHAWKASPVTQARDCSAAEERLFGGWADETWERARSGYSFVAVRDCGSLNHKFPASDERLHRLRVRDARGEIGWAVVTDHQHSGDQYFGDMRLGAVVDCLARPGSEGSVMASAVQFLRGRGVDLMVSNQCADIWQQALRRCGFVGSPSNFIFAPTPQLTGKILGADAEMKRVHINRGDGDGPINL